MHGSSAPLDTNVLPRSFTEAKAEYKAVPLAERTNRFYAASWSLFFSVEFSSVAGSALSCLANGSVTSAGWWIDLDFCSF
jgi:hypothetical protein